MVRIVKTKEKEKKKSGRPCQLKIEDQILLTLEYLSGHLTILRSPQNPCP